VTQDIQSLQKELDAARAEILSLRLRLANVTLLLAEEMTASGRLPKVEARPSATEARAT
jgi:hypothetical protein